MQKYDSVKNLSSTAFKRLTGVRKFVFLEMVSIIRKAEITKKINGGKPSRLGIEDKVLMALEYLREYRTSFHLGQSYGISESACYRNCKMTREKSVMLDHEKLDVYHVTVEFVIAADETVEHLPRGRGYLSDQLQRAALSISLNIAEGAGEYSVDEKIRFYRMAKRSATECAGILDVCQRLQLIDEKRYVSGRQLLIRIVSMLIKMAQKSY
jgi:four helix bundle protein